MSSDLTSSPNAELLNEFAEEATASLRGLPEQLDAFRRDPTQLEPINAVFRAVHSIKGNASFFGFVAIKSFAHTLENTLDDIRKQKFGLTTALQREIIASIDQIEEMIGIALGDGNFAPCAPRCQELLDGIAKAIAQNGSSKTPGLDLAQILEELCRLQIAGHATPVEWLETVAAHHLDELNQKVATRSGEAAAEQIATAPAPNRPTPAALAEAPLAVTAPGLGERLAGLLEIFLSFEAGTYTPAVGKDFVARGREFAGWAQSASRDALRVKLEAAASNVDCILNSPLPMDGRLLTAVWDDLWPELAKLVSFGEVAPTNPAAATSAAKSESNTQAKEGAGNRSVRVKEERLDEFLTVVSRLFITGEILKDLSARMTETGQIRALVDELRQTLRSFYEQATALQKGLFSLRRVAISNLFAKCPRMIRGLAQQLEKCVDVKLVGEETEIDKGLLEDLDAPLTHLLRNAVDHGIETPEVRKSRGVSEEGTVTLTAELTRTHVRISIADDGRGIDPARLKAKAVEKGIMTVEQAAGLSDDEARQLIFHAGFSTAEKLSDVSGRGVGLDVVRTAIRKHNGEVYIDSVVGQGTTFRIEVPLRDAVIVIDGLMVRHAGQEFVVPFEHIHEISEFRNDNTTPVLGSQVTTVRGSIYESRALNAVLGIDLPTARGAQTAAVLVGSSKGRLCLLVDQVIGNRKVVVNSIQHLLPSSSKIAGVAQLGGGRLALVLNVPEVIEGMI